MPLQFNNLKIFRMKENLTQEDIAEKLGVSRQSVAKWERGESLPDIESCVKLADMFGVTVDVLVRNMQEIPHVDEEGKHIFGIARLNEKGQITLPAECRRIFGLKAGDSVLVLGDEEKGGIALVNIGNNITE